MGDESPLFGGKERLSSQTGNGGRPLDMDAIPIRDTETSASSESLKVGGNRPDANEILTLSGRGPPVSRACKEADIPRIPGTGQANHKLRVVRWAPSKALSRLSTLSGLVHPGPMYEGPRQENIGIAVGWSRPGVWWDGECWPWCEQKGQYTEHGEAPEYNLWITRRPRVHDVTECPAPVADEDQGDGFLRQGRARVKAPYGAGSYFRGSASSTDEPNQKWVTPMNVRWLVIP
jgi:hypothetical protein